jgi:cytochrome c peroxidase
MMTPSDLALVQDPEFKKIVETYAKDEEVFKKEFAAAFGKLMVRDKRSARARTRSA